MYAVLFALLAVMIFASFAFEDHPLVERFGNDLATEVVSVIVTLAFVQRLLEREERARRLRAAVGALRKSRVALADMVEVWAELVKAALDPQGTEYPRTVEQLFAPHYTEHLASLQPPAGPDGGGKGGEEWPETAARRLVRAQERFREVIRTYAATLDPDYVEALDEIVDDPFVELFADLARRRAPAEEWRKRINQSRGHLQAHFVRLLCALELHNRIGREAARFRNRQFVPTARGLSVQLGADADLAIHTELERGWWAVPPAIGALRAPRVRTRASLPPRTP